MNFLKNQKKNIKRFNDPLLMGGYIKRYSIIYIVLLFVVAFFEFVLFTREMIAPHKDSFRNITYIISYVVLFLASIGAGVYLVLAKNKKDNEKTISLILHTYALIAVLWGALVSYVDYLGDAEFPVVFFTIVATIGGLLVLNPYIFIPFVIVSGTGLFTAMSLTKYLKTGNIINISVLFIMIIIITYRTNTVAANEEDQRQMLIKMSTTDTLTNLKNENAYYQHIVKLEKKLEKDSKTKFAVILMDVNGLKYTDDTYGHRFGAHLISTAGKILPTVFVNSDVFHVGGDEFVCIVSEHLDKLDEYLETFKEKLEYSKITFEGTELFLSLAMGHAVHEEGELYNETFQRADKNMYVNKAKVKKTYNILGR